MAKIKLTKTELKAQTDALKRFQRFLPMLQLKKQQLQSEIAGIVAKAEEVYVVRDAKVAAHFVLLNVAGTDSYYYLGIVAQLHQHFQLAVGFKTWEYTTGVVVVEKLTAKFKVEFVSKLGDALLDVFGLYPQILLVVKSVFHNL